MSERRRRASQRASTAEYVPDHPRNADRPVEQDDFEDVHPVPRRVYQDPYREPYEQIHVQQTPIIVNVTNTATLTAIASEEAGSSLFDGGLLGLIGWRIFGILITVLTLGICFPLAVVKIYKWKIDHTVINGRRLLFTGTAASLFGNWMKWLLLSIITLGIYSFWVVIKLEQWKVSHTTFQR